jgi:hypothetical protein
LQSENAGGCATQQKAEYPLIVLMVSAFAVSSFFTLRSPRLLGEHYCY